MRPLTSAVSSCATSSTRNPRNWSIKSWLQSKRLISKSILVILLWNVLVKMTYGMVLLSPAGFIFQRRLASIPFWIMFHILLGGYCLLGLVQVLYPIGGLLADIYCGRYKIIILSLFNIWCGFLLSTVIGVVYSVHMFLKIEIPGTTSIEIVAGMLAFAMFVIGFSGFQANIVQFSLDQLLDASSEEHSLFLHWLVWTEYVGELAMKLLVTGSPYSNSLRITEGFLTIGLLIISTIFLIIGCRRRRWFHCEKTVRNPYRNLYNVIKFIVKHNKPIGYRSALTFSDDIKPSRIDYAKQIYGGPFTTEIVEDVKTCLRIFVMLLAIVPTLSFEVPTNYLFPVFAVHLGTSSVLNFTFSYEWMLFESGNLSHIISVVWIPLYIILVYPHIKRWVPRILYRMGLSVALIVTSVAFMFIMQVIASSYAYHNTDVMNITCPFLSEYRHYRDVPADAADRVSPTLGFPSQALVVLNLLNGIATPLLSITVLEFISAQSPHTMKGLLLGIFYAFRGLAIALECILTLPFIQESLWAGHNGVFDCGFYYYLCNTVFGVAGLVVFVMAARWYRYRERDDPPYGHQYAEEYYSRYLSAPTQKTRLVEEAASNYRGFNIQH